MTAFEFVFFLYAIMLSLALTHLISGWAMALRHARAIQWSVPHVLWAISALLLTTGNLASFWLMRDAPSWGAGLVLSNFAFAVVNYVWCVFITPELARGKVLDLATFHEKERRRYLAPLVILEAFAIVSNVANGLYAGYANWITDSALSILLLGLTLAAIFCGRWVQVAVAIPVLAISIWFVFTASNIIGT